MKTRNQKICEYRVKGMTLQEIGKKFGISHVRIRQIVEREKEKCSEEIKTKILSKQKHQYHQPRNILSPEKQLRRKKWIYQYYKNGTSIKDIAQIFFTISTKKIKEIIDEMTPEMRKCKFCIKEFIAKGEEKRNICPKCFKKFLFFEKTNLRYGAIIRFRFGLENGATHTLEETGKEFGVTRERIRQIEAKSFEMLKALE